MAHLWLPLGMPRKQRPAPYAGPYSEYECHHAADTPLVALSDGTLFPESVNLTVVVRGDGPATVAEVGLEVAEGHPVVTAVSIRRVDLENLYAGPISVTPAMLHNLNFGKIFESAVQTGAFMGIGFENPIRDKPAALAAAARAGALARRRQPLSDSLLEEVANIVNHNQYDPRKQVASDLHVSERTASRWIAEVKRRGLLDKKEAEDE